MAALSSQKYINITKPYTISENPVKCDCNLRPLKHYLSTLNEIPSSYSSITCELPVYLNGQYFVNVTDDLLHCTDKEKTPNSDEDDFNVQPDLRFREVYL